ncbi:MAG: glycosyltransferase [Pyrinomonadaceae bacterium]|nr:glycosyltransferase [Pyrinomonadaceae bacterium]
MRILWLKTELLHPIDKGGKIRTYNMLRELKREHHITYLTLDDGTSDKNARARADEYCDQLICVPHQQREKFTARFYYEVALNLLSSLPYAIKKYESKKMRSAIAEQMNFDLPDVLVCDFLTPALNIPKSLPCPAVLFQHNVEAMIWKRHYEVQTNPAKRAYLYGQWRKMEHFERRTCRRFDCVVAVSYEDREMMKKEYDLKQVYDVPTGVDTEYFRDSGREPRDPHNLVFTGSMDWLPNEDAIRYFTEEILPLVQKAVPDVTLTVVGRNPFPTLMELSKREPSIVVTGRVDDVRPYIERAAVYVVPLRIGGGTRLKIYEAMAMEKAIVSTTIGAEGLPVRGGADLLLADTVEAFAEAVVKILNNEGLARRLGQQAASGVKENFGWRNVAQSFASICERAIEIGEPAGSPAPLQVKTESSVQ